MTHIMEVMIVMANQIIAILIKPNDTNLQLEPDTNNTPKSIPDAGIPGEAKDKLKEIFHIKYTSIMSQTAMDIGRTNLIELDILTEGKPIASKPYTVSLKYHEFVDHEIKQLEEAGIISRSMSNWANPILVVPKKEDCVEKIVNLILGYVLTIESSTVE